MHWYLEVLKKYAVFSGRARRKEFWVFAFVWLLAGLGIVIVESLIETRGLLVGFYVLGMLIPSLAVAVRRLHDTNRSGWWLLIGLIPLIGQIILIVFLFQDSDSGANAYGPNPKSPKTGIA